MDGTDLFAWAVEYERRGWSLVALHSVTVEVGADGAPHAVCSCGNDSPRHFAQAGKHPRDRAWQNASASPMTWQQGRHNIGIRTGTPSGFWVLDYDPLAGGETLSPLYHTLIAEGYAPHVRTGGGGFHWRFRLPGFEVRNRQSAGGGAGRTHALPMGWDVRGEGGQVVAPPSVTAKGAYVELSAKWDQRSPYEAPAWLLDMIRPQAVDRGVDMGDPPGHMVSPVPAGASAGRPGAEAQNTAGLVEGSSRPADQIQAYANGALRDELSRYEEMADGRRGDPAFYFACNLVEIANLAGWSHDVVFPYFEASSLRAGANAGGGGYAQHELPYQWERAREHVGDRKREMQSRVDVLPPFPSAGPGPAELTLVDPGSITTSAGGGGSHGVNGAHAAPTTGGATQVPEQVFAPALQVDPWQRKVAARVEALDVDEAAKAYRSARDAAGRPSLASKVLTGDTLDAVPDPVPLIDGWLFLDSTGRINGKPGQGKSFVAADLLCSVATGTPWAGVPVRQGPVLAIVAEGVSGFKLRIRAWESERGVKVGAALHLIPEPVQTLDPAAWGELVAYAAALRPVLVTLDTQARISVGARENDSTDMGRVVAAVEELRRATGACVLLVHHAVKSGEAEAGRGSNAVEGATVSEFYVSKSGHLVKMKTTRQKDIESEAKVSFDLKPVDKSAVLVHRLEVADPVANVGMWKVEAIALYEILRTGKANGQTWAEMFKEAKESPTFSGKRTTFITQAWNNLLMRGLVVHGVNSGDKAKFSVHVREEHGPDGVLTPNVGEWAVSDPAGWQTYRPDLIKDDADFTVNLGKAGRLDSSRLSRTK